MKKQITQMEKELFEAVEIRNIDKVKELLDKGVNVNARRKFGGTPLMAAVFGGFIPVDINLVKLLLEYGADVNAQNYLGTSVLMFAVHSENVNLVKYLLKINVDINAQDTNGDTALIYSAWLCRDSDVIKLLLQNGADVNIKNKEGKTAIDIARERRYVGEIIRLLEIKQKEEK